MWQCRRQWLTARGAVRIRVDNDGAAVSYARVLQCWRDDPGFRSFFMELLADSPWTAFRWETPPVTEATADRAFECVLVDSPELLREPDAGAFAEHFADTDDQVIAFPNLGGDATMVVPRPFGPATAYGHLGAFARQAPACQAHALWALVGATMQARLGAEPVWLSTAGAGVPWVHLRLDSRPKYYCHPPYLVE